MLGNNELEGEGLDIPIDQLCHGSTDSRVSVANPFLHILWPSGRSLSVPAIALFVLLQLEKVVKHACRLLFLRLKETSSPVSLNLVNADTEIH